MGSCRPLGILSNLDVLISYLISHSDDWKWDWAGGKGVWLVYCWLKLTRLASVDHGQDHSLNSTWDSQVSGSLLVASSLQPARIELHCRLKRLPANWSGRLKQVIMSPYQFIVAIITATQSKYDRNCILYGEDSKEVFRHMVFCTISFALIKALHIHICANSGLNANLLC